MCSVVSNHLPLNLSRPTYHIGSVCLQQVAEETKTGVMRGELQAAKTALLSFSMAEDAQRDVGK